ncbi:hypothetical protein E2320_008152 [Naja naja]|nr:hypothetical protein E2320_008152 [Naja naja]
MSLLAPPCSNWKERSPLQSLWSFWEEGNLPSRLAQNPQAAFQAVLWWDRWQDEVIAASEKVTVKLEDLAQWAQTDISKWKRGLRDEAFTPLELRKDGQREALSRFRQSTHNSGLNFKDILKEKADLAVQLVLESSWPMKTVFEGCWDQGNGLALERERNWMVFLDTFHKPPPELAGQPIYALQSGKK